MLAVAAFVKTVENMGQVFTGYTCAVIGGHNGYLPLSLAAGKGYGGGGIADGVGYDGGKGPGHVPGITVHIDRLFIKVENKLYLAFLGQTLQAPDTIGKQFPQIAFLQCRAGG